MTKARDIASAIPAPSTVSSAELGFLDGVTSAIQTQVDAKTAKSTLTTTGDIYYASAANTPARLAIGSTSDVLTVAGGIPSWAAPAGGPTNWTLLNAGGTALTAAATITVSFTAPKRLMILMIGASGGARSFFTLRPNNISTADYSAAGFIGVLLDPTEDNHYGRVALHGVCLANVQLQSGPAEAGAGLYVCTTDANYFYIPDSLPGEQFQVAVLLERLATTGYHPSVLVKIIR